jgi:hypothetical protein
MDRLRRQEWSIKPHFRATVLDWLTAVAASYRLSLDSLYLAASILDRALDGGVPVLRTNLQLIAITALMMASKLQDVKPLTVSRCFTVCAKTFTHDEVLYMEIAIGNVLAWRLYVPVSYSFMALLIANDGDTTSNVELFAQYMLDLSLAEYASLCVLPSVLAGAVLCMARQHANISPVLGDATALLLKCTVADLRPVALLICDMLQSRNGALVAVQLKYKTNILVLDDAWAGLAATISTQWYASNAAGTVLQALSWGLHAHLSTAQLHRIDASQA